MMKSCWCQFPGVLMGNFFHPHHPGISWTSSPRRQNGGITRRPTNVNSLPVAVTCHWWRSSGEKFLTHLFRKGIIFLCSLSSPGKVAKNLGLTLAHRSQFSKFWKISSYWLLQHLMVTWLGPMSRKFSGPNKGCNSIQACPKWGRHFWQLFHGKNKIKSYKSHVMS